MTWLICTIYALMLLFHDEGNEGLLVPIGLWFLMWILAREGRTIRVLLVALEVEAAKRRAG